MRSALPAAKDETDLELALLLAVERYPEPVVVLGAFGGRLDQHLANILLLTHEVVRDRPVKLVAPYQEMCSSNMKASFVASRVTPSL